MSAVDRITFLERTLRRVRLLIEDDACPECVEYVESAFEELSDAELDDDSMMAIDLME